MQATQKPYSSRVKAALERLGIHDINHAISTGQRWAEGTGGAIDSHSPVDGSRIAASQAATVQELDVVLRTAETAFETWRDVPAPKRGEVVRQIGEAFRKHKEDLGLLVSYEMGKIYQEGLGEVQEIIDICDFAVGLSRQLYGLTMPSERPSHRLQERWHPIGVVGVISAFNFPVAVWSWNAMIAAVCGDVVVWKPSEKTPLCGTACMKIIADVLNANDVPEGVFSMVQGERNIGQALAADKRVALLSATGSTRMGYAVGETVSKRMGRYLLELGGNNAVIVSEHADLDLAIPAIVFSAVGTTGQRCTSCRRVIIHESQYEAVKEHLTKIYAQLTDKIGNPLTDGTLIGPLVDADAVQMMQTRIAAVQAEGGKLVTGGSTHTVQGHEGHYVLPAIVEAQPKMESVQTETFAPILYLLKYSTIQEAIDIQNGVPQGLSSSIFTLNMREAELFISQSGSDCGIANVNVGTSGAEIGGAFGGEKETGGGRESGSDAWKAYMRRQTITVNYGDDLPLAQGINFNI